MPYVRDSGQSSDMQLYLPFAARLRARDASGRRLEMHSVLDWLSPSALHLRLSQPVCVGERLPITVRLMLPGEERGLGLLVDGVVWRVQEEAQGLYGVDVRFRRHWLLPGSR